MNLQCGPFEVGFYLPRCPGVSGLPLFVAKENTAEWTDGHPLKDILALPVLGLRPISCYEYSWKMIFMHFLGASNGK